MMIGERDHSYIAAQVTTWYSGDQTANIHFSSSPRDNAGEDFSPSLQNDAALKAFQRYLPSNSSDGDCDNGEFPAEAYSCDQFRIYEFKVRKCARGRSHDWTECPFAHPGEKARRRDPRAYQYSGTACPDFRKGNCRKGDACEFAHGVFECWLHPARYRTQPCKDGLNCKRRVCFFAHSPEQLRVLSPRCESYDGSPQRYAKTMHFVSSPESVSPPSESPPMSPMTAANSVNSLSRSLGSNYINEMVASLRQLQLNKVKSMPSSWSVQIGSPAHGSPGLPVTRPGFCSLPSTPTRCMTRPGACHFDLWEESLREEEEIPMERVESGRDLRARMFQKLSEENPLDGADPNPNPFDAPNPDVGWVSDLIN